MGSEFIITEKNKEKILIFLVVSFSFVLRFYKLHANDFWLDEVYTIIISKLDFPQMLENLIKSCQPPLHYFFMHFWIKYFNFNDYFLEIPSAIFGALTVLVTYIFAKGMFDKKIAFSTAIFVALSPVAIFFSKETRPYSLLILFTTLSMYYFYKLVEDEDNKKNSILFIVYSALAFYTQYVFIYFLIAQNVYVIIINRKLFLKFISLQFLIFLLFLPWLPTFIKQLKITSVMTLAGQKISIITFVKFLYITNKMNLPTLLLPLLFQRLIIPLMIFISIIYLTVKKQQKVFFLFLYLIFPIFIAVLLSKYWRSTFVDRQFTPSLIPYFIFLSVGIISIFKNNFSRVSIVLSVSFMLMFTSLNTVYKWNDTSYSSTLKYLNKNKKENIVIISLGEHTTLPFIYYNKYKLPLYIFSKFRKNHIDSFAFKIPCNYCRYYDNSSDLLRYKNKNVEMYLIFHLNESKEKRITNFIRFLKMHWLIKKSKKIQFLQILCFAPKKNN